MPLSRRPTWAQLCIWIYIDLSTKISFWFQLVCTLANSKYANNKLYQQTCQTNQDATEKCVLQLRAQLKHKPRPSRNNVFVPEFCIYTHNRAAPQRHWWLVVEFTEFRVWLEHKPWRGSWWGTDWRELRFRPHYLPPCGWWWCEEGCLSRSFSTTDGNPSFSTQSASTLSTRRRRRSMASKWGWMRMGANWSCSSDSSIRELSLNSSLANSCSRRYVDLFTLRERER